MNIQEHIKDKKLKVKVKPGAKETAVVGWNNGQLEIKLKAVPEKGKANQELLKFLKKDFGIKAKIIHGQKSREKIIEIV